VLQPHQAFVMDLYRFKIQIMIKGRARHPEGYGVFLQYLEHLRTRLLPVSEQVRFESPYYDYLQSPLQPLMDNLESQTVGNQFLSTSPDLVQAFYTLHLEGSSGSSKVPIVFVVWQYETFERDPIKYAQYEAAIAAALAKTPPDNVSVIMVVGAGRGQ
jgi:type II protein arginine methyltransferase